MKIDIAYIRLVLLVVLLHAMQLSYSREEASPLMPLNGYNENLRLDIKSESALDYRYQARDWSMPRYADSVSVGSRLYMTFGYGKSRSWESIKQSGEQRLKFGLGYSFTPVHSIELKGNFGESYSGATATYYMNLNNAALRRDAHSRFEVFLGAGADTRVKGEDITVGLATALKGQYNLTRNLGLYVETRATFNTPVRGAQSGTNVTGSFEVGISYKFGQPEFYVMDYILPKALRNPKRLSVSYEYDVLPLLAVKSNLLFDLATALNVSIEVPIRERWSISAEWMFPWWLSDDNATAFQVLSGSIEGRYWFGNRKNKFKMTGLFAGYYVGGGLYDLRTNSKGYQGEFYIASGLSGGYSHAIIPSGALRMEYSLSVGYLSTDYRYYEGRADNLFMVWQYDGHFAWFGPTKSAISLVWMLNVNKRRR